MSADLIIEYKAAIIIAVFGALFLWEHLRPAVPAKPHTVRRLIKNLSFWPINIGLSLAVILPVTYLAAQYSLWQRPDMLSGLAGLALDIVLLELFLFWWHRAVHEVPFLWRFHEVHHLDQQLDTTSAIRFHFGEIFFATFVRALVIIMFAVPFSSVIIFEILVLGLTLFHHSNIALPRRFENALSKVIITPSIHWVHHHILPRDTNSNYGTIFSFWDPLFQTKSQTRRYTEMPIGIKGRRDTNFIHLLQKPFLKRKP
jgi:sterol desaturase/sphingolipid hydroxylase (fatty acid hydroxylase superfamily)